MENASKMYNDSQRWRKEVDLLGMMRAQEAGENVFEERQTVADDGWKMCACERGWVAGVA